MFVFEASHANPYRAAKIIGVEGSILRIGGGGGPHGEMRSNYGRELVAFLGKKKGLVRSIGGKEGSILVREGRRTDPD